MGSTGKVPCDPAQSEDDEWPTRGTTGTTANSEDWWQSIRARAKTFPPPDTAARKAGSHDGYASACHPLVGLVRTAASAGLRAEFEVDRKDSSGFNKFARWMRKIARSIGD
jgi:hypothetical protein